MNQFEKIAVIDNGFESQLLESILNERNIPHLLKSYHDVAYGNLFQFHKGWGTVNAPIAFKAEILEIISDIREGYTWEDK